MLGYQLADQKEDKEESEQEQEVNESQKTTNSIF
jgi:hypothetical protein